MTYYKSIHKLPLSIFIDCYVDDNLNALVIEGDVSNETLQNAWFNIQSDFAFMMGNNEQKLFITLLKEVNELKATMNQVETLLDTMEFAYNIEFGRLVNKILKATFPWPERDRVLINKLIVSSRSQLKSVDMKLEIKMAGLKGLQAKLISSSANKPTRQYFDLLMNLVEEHFGVPVDENMFTPRFCDKVKRMNEDFKKNKYGKPARR